MNKYIEKYKGIAVNEMKLYRIPASITLAQGILESNAGRSDLALQANNHFGIKCHKEWTGRTFIKDDETKNECFRKYDDPLESFRDHSMFLTTRDRYKGLFLLDPSDYKGWANGLKSAGYATNPAYPQLLIKMVETYFLNRFDRAALDGPVTGSLVDSDIRLMQAWMAGLVVTGSGPGNRKIYENNGLRMIIAGDDDNLYAIAGDMGISTERLLEYNDLQSPGLFKKGQVVYLEPKRRKGASDFHEVRRGESLYSISQQYGVKLKKICRRNGLRPGVEPATGTRLRLR